MKKIFLSVTNDLVTDQRVHKVAISLQKSNAEVTLVGRKLKNSLPLSERQYKTKRINFLFTRGAGFYIEYNIRLFFYLLFKKVDILVANDLDSLLANYLVSCIKRKPLVYDSHEYYTEVPELVNRPFPKKIWLLIEKAILPRIKHAYTVSNEIAITYNKLYNINMSLIRNVPYYLNGNISRNSHNKEKVILYQGSLNIGRGLEPMIDAMKYLDNFKLQIIGSGDLSDELKDRVQNQKLNDKIEFLGKIPFCDLPQYTINADIGIALEENIGLNYYYALPNKLFDYIQAGVPVLVSPFPEMQQIVQEYDIGTVYDHSNPEVLAKKITE
ncbi:MAG: glycosyltransferase, partial [Bacteroidota bacterium]|nr:glycosyltransferase [Bacteroidota bacterium]